MARRGAGGGRAAIWVLLGATFIAILNETVMSVAVPVFAADLGLTAPVAQWVTTAFLLTMAVVVPATGYLIDRFPLRGLFAASQGLFVAGTALGAIAPGFALVLAGRVTQAAGTAVLLPLLMTTVLRLVPEHRRGAMMGTMSVVIAVAPAIGPTVSGALLRASGGQWRMLFAAMAPVAVAALAIGLPLLPRHGGGGARRLDPASLALAAAGFGGSVHALAGAGPGAGPGIWASAAVGAAALALFARRQLRLAREGAALLDPAVFRTRAFGLTAALLAAGFAAMFGVIIILPLHLAARGVDVLVIGLMLMPGPLAMGLLGPLIGRWYDAAGPRPLVLPGTVALTASLTGLSFLGEAGPLWWIVVCHVVLELGLGLVFTPLFAWGLGELPEALQADGSAVLNTLQQVAGAAGTACFVAIAAAVAGLAAGGGPADLGALVAGHRAAMATGAALGALMVVLAARIRPRPRPRVELA